MRFSPKQHVIVTLFGLRYRGRVVRNILEPSGEWLYDVQYSNDTGDLKRSEFLEDELEEQP